jgi:hypothetical protein
MGVTIWRTASMDQLVKKLKLLYPDLKFTEGKNFYWSPATSEIFYAYTSHKKHVYFWSLLHETGHALLNHDTYETDMQLLLLECDAWKRAQLLGKELGIDIESNHIQDCLDSYRDWLDMRSTCPTCRIKGLQIDAMRYRCINCHTLWSVSRSRFCRPYRATSTEIKSHTAIWPD